MKKNYMLCMALFISNIHGMKRLYTVTKFNKGYENPVVSIGHDENMVHVYYKQTKDRKNPGKQMYIKATYELDELPYHMGCDNVSATDIAPLRARVKLSPGHELVAGQGGLIVERRDGKEIEYVDAHKHGITAMLLISMGVSEKNKNIKRYTLVTGDSIGKVIAWRLRLLEEERETSEEKYKKDMEEIKKLIGKKDSDDDFGLEKLFDLEK